METAVVILNWNGAKYLEEFLPILIENTSKDNVEIIVADNFSIDNSLALLSEKFSSIRTILLDKNYGFAAGYNKALEQVSADYFLLLNSDVEVTANWLEPMVNYLKENQDVSACQPKILSYHQREYFEHAGAAGGFIDKYGFPFCRGRVFDNLEVDKGQYDSVADVFWASGACLLVRSDLFWKVGGFDADFFAHMEEIDLCWRFKSRGYRVVCQPDSVVYHIGGGTLSSESPFKTYLNFRNNLFLLYKNLPATRLNVILSKRKWFDYLAALNYLLRGKLKNAQSVLKARSDFKNNRGRFTQKRAENLLYFTKNEHLEILDKSLVTSFFLETKKTFLELFD